MNLTWRDCVAPLLLQRVGLVGGERLVQLGRTLRDGEERGGRVRELTLVLGKGEGGSALRELLPLLSARRLVVGGWVDLEVWEESFGAYSGRRVTG